ncbi:glycoside hydrolase family 5 protein [Parapedobacter deserti]|uniref:Glycoside hydrolase family 5 protein n=1 Tax=Parapedobacter deserti TaxID=1912957 RepID=A0ABV7JIM6_9SPHI
MNQLLLILLLGLSTSGQNAQLINTPIAKHGPLEVKGGRIVNQHNQPPQLRGISFSWSIWNGQKYYTPETVDWLVDDFSVSLVRLSMAIEPTGGYLEQPEIQTERITRLADRAIERGIYVIIDWHDHNAERNKAQAEAFFSLMAKRYAAVPNVIYEIWNEPEQQPWSVIKTYAEAVISAIRSHDPHNLIVVGTPRWAQDVDIAAAEPISGFTNIAYAFHFYASDPHHQERLRNKADKAIKMGLPLLVTEWGVGEANGDGVFDTGKTAKWLQWMEDRQLSWANWNLTDKAETTGLLLPGASPLGNWPVSQLSPAGQYIRTELKKSAIRQ